MTQPKSKAEEELKKAEEQLTSQPEEEADKELPVPEEQQPELSEEEEAQESEPASDLNLGQQYAELAEKKGFKSPDALAKSYEELEKRTNRVEQMARNALKKVTQPEEVDQGVEILRNVVREELREAMTPIREDKDRQMVAEEIKNIQNVYPDFKGQIVDDAVRLAAQGRAKNLEDAYKLLTYDIATKLAREKAQKEEKDTQKKQAFAESATGSAGSKETDFESMTLEELEQVLPKAGDFIDHKGNFRRV